MTPEQSLKEPPLLFIVKPEAGCQGKGIFIVQKLDELQARIDNRIAHRNQQRNDYLDARETADTQARHEGKVYPSDMGAANDQGVAVSEEKDKRLNLDNTFVV